MGNSFIRANKIKSLLIMTVFILLVMAMGGAYSLYIGDSSRLYPIGLMAIGYAFISYFMSSKIALSLNRAKQVDQSTEPRLYNIVQKLAAKNEMPMPKVYIINDKSPNAFATGRDPDHAHVAATKGILELLDDQELEGVMAHEMGHVKNYDIRLMMVVMAFITIISIIRDMIMYSSWFGGSSDEDSSPIIGLITIGSSILIPIIAFMVQMAVSRRREYLADATGAATTHQPKELASALAKIQQSSLKMKRQNIATAHLFFANPLQSRALSSLFSTHPPTKDRIERLNEMQGKV